MKLRLKKINTRNIVLLVLILMVLIFYTTQAYSKNNDSASNNSNYSNSVALSNNGEIEFYYIFNNDVTDNTEKSVLLNKKNVAQAELILPTRQGYIFDGWFADWMFSTRVSDNKGKIIIGEKLFSLNSNKLYAKWINENASVYPILMVFVTEIQASLNMYMSSSTIDIVYSMTTSEREVCLRIASYFEDCLNAMLNGVVSFRVDTYFTNEVVRTQSFSPSIGVINDYIQYDYGIWADTIPELGGVEWSGTGSRPSLEEIETNGLLSDYKSIITSFNMNDYNNILHCTGGSSTCKYSRIHMESLFGGVVRNGGTVDYILELDEPNAKIWYTAFMELYLHEFTHSVELYQENKDLNTIDFHEAKRRYMVDHYTGSNISGPSNSREIEFIRLYLLNQVQIEGCKCGIPVEFWNN